MVDKEKKIWLDGEFIDWDEAKVHVLTHSLHYGLAAFDGMRAYQRSDGGTYIFRLREHVDRLFDSCKMCLLQPKFTREVVERVCVDTLKINGMVDGYLRPMVFIGEGAMGIYVPQNPVLTAVIAWRWGAYLGDEALKNGIRAKIGSFARHHINVSLAKAKMNGQYTNSVLAKREAKLGGYDEAILLDANGYVSEGSGENIFVVRKGVVYTPDLSCSILEGVTRDTVITLAREMGITVVECRLTRDQLWLADEVFLTGTAAEITPVREVDNRAIGAGTVGPMHQADPGALLRRGARQRRLASRVADAGVSPHGGGGRRARLLVVSTVVSLAPSDFGGVRSDGASGGGAARIPRGGELPRRRLAAPALSFAAPSAVASASRRPGVAHRRPHSACARRHARADAVAPGGLRVLDGRTGRPRTMRGARAGATAGARRGAAGTSNRRGRSRHHPGDVRHAHRGHAGARKRTRLLARRARDGLRRLFAQVLRVRLFDGGRCRHG